MKRCIDWCNYNGFADIPDGLSDIYVPNSNAFLVFGPIQRCCRKKVQHIKLGINPRPKGLSISTSYRPVWYMHIEVQF